MASMFDSALALWSWPVQAAAYGRDLTETMLGAQRVVAARMPIIGAALVDPLNADHRELSMMVTEKVAAFGKSRKSSVAAGRAMQRASDANAQGLQQLASGKPLWPGDWFGLAELNLAAAAAFVALPAAALAPIHRGVSRNDKRFRR